MKEIALPRIVLDRMSAVTLQRQLRDQMASAIHKGLIARDALLPSTRTLAHLLGISRNTVVIAYENLVADGLIVGKPGSGMHVCGATQVPSFDVTRVLRSAHYPNRVAHLQDLDGNSIGLNF